MATDIGPFCAMRATLHGFRREGRLVGPPPVGRIGRSRHGRGAWHQRHIGLAFALGLCFPCVLLSSEPAMEILTDRASMAISGISPKTVKDMARANDLGDPDRWPVYKTTGHPMYRLPAGFIRREKDHPEWDVKRLIEYRIAFRTYTDGETKQRVVFLYRREVNVMFVLYIDMPQKESDPNSPF
jgi:hypothetical protein